MHDKDKKFRLLRLKSTVKTATKAASWQKLKSFFFLFFSRRAVHVTAATLWMKKNATSATAGWTHAKLKPDGETEFSSRKEKKNNSILDI